MKKYFAALTFALLATQAHADWVRIDYPTDQFATYIDRDSLKKTGVGIFQMWHVYDYKSAQDLSGQAYLSVKGQDEYECDKGARRHMLSFYHTDGMGNNKMVQAVYKPGPWVTPEAGSVDEALVRIACGK